MDLRPLADEDERLGVREPARQFVGVLGVVVPHRNFVSSQFREAVECLERVEVVVEDRDLQCPPLLSVLSNQFGAMSLTVSQWSDARNPWSLRSDISAGSAIFDCNVTRRRRLPKRWLVTLRQSGSV